MASLTLMRSSANIEAIMTIYTTKDSAIAAATLATAFANPATAEVTPSTPKAATASAIGCEDSLSCMVHGDYDNDPFAEALEAVGAGGEREAAAAAMQPAGTHAAPAGAALLSLAAAAAAAAGAAEAAALQQAAAGLSQVQLLQQLPLLSHQTVPPVFIGAAPGRACYLVPSSGARVPLACAQIVVEQFCMQLPGNDG